MSLTTLGRSLLLVAIVSALASPLSAAVYPVEGVEAIDGDSIRVRFPSGLLVEVRLVSIDCPEHDQALGAQARRLTDSLVREKPLRLVTGSKERDRHNRLLAFAELETSSVNERLLDAGLAVVWVIPPNTDRVDALLDAQRGAWKAQRGIWGPDGPAHDPRTHRHRKDDASGKSHRLDYARHVVVGNRRSRVAHWPGCIHVDEMSQRNVQRFTSTAAAIEAGFRMERGSR